MTEEILFIQEYCHCVDKTITNRIYSRALFQNNDLPKANDIFNKNSIKFKEIIFLHKINTYIEKYLLLIPVTIGYKGYKSK